MEIQYLTLLNNVLQNGEDRPDRTGVGTISLFGQQIRCNLKDGFPLLTSKRMGFKSVLSELLWFIEGSGDERRLAEILHGTRDKTVTVSSKINGENVNTERAVTTIWTDNANSSYWLPKRQFPGDLGRVYGVQWRNWQSMKLISSKDSLSHPSGGMTYYGAKVQVNETDQIKNVIDKLKNNPTDRRMIVSAFNVGEIDQMALPPCHMFCQFYSNSKKELSCQVYIRSSDLALGLPYNIASYALLTHMIAQVTGHTVGELVMSLGDCHIYKNHIDGVKEQLARNIFKLPSLIINPDIADIDSFKMNDFFVNDYASHGSILFPMAV